jgi:hypothetical protein
MLRNHDLLYGRMDASFIKIGPPHAGIPIVAGNLDSKKGI